MLELRLNCERCDGDLAADGRKLPFAGICQNCGGALVTRPARLPCW